MTVPDPKPERVPELLVSVRSADEARAALAGGAALIDVKEPAHGPRGRASDVVIAGVVAAVAGRRPVSAALGEWADAAPEPKVAGLTFIKRGLAGSHRSDWRASSWWPDRPPERVVVAYADWQCAQAPPVEDVVEFALARPGGTLLLDTHCKAPSPSLARPPTLLDWLDVEWLTSLCRRCEQAGVRIALAGSLGVGEITTLRGARPTWFAVRGAACDGGTRDGAVCTERVRALVRLIEADARRSRAAG